LFLHQILSFGVPLTTSLSVSASALAVSRLLINGSLLSGFVLILVCLSSYDTCLCAAVPSISLTTRLAPRSILPWQTLRLNVLEAEGH
jgi:hypothetical protein